MTMTCGSHLGDDNSSRNSSGACEFDHDFGLEIKSRGKTKIFVRGTGVTVNAAMLAAAIRIQARPETNVRTVIVGNGRLAVINKKLRAWQHIFLRIPVSDPVRDGFSRSGSADFPARRDGRQ